MQTDRCWDQDGRMLTPRDARQCVDAYRSTSPGRRRWLLEQSCRNGYRPEITAVFRAALEELTR